MKKKDISDKFKERYKDIHPLIFARSIERAKTLGDLFDILETVPKNYPLIWNEEAHRWIFTEDLFQANNKRQRD